MVGFLLNSTKNQKEINPMNKPRVLLTANYVPNDLVLGEDITNLMSTRWSRKHGNFQMDFFGHYFALYLLAENLSCPTTVLESPHWEEFDRELEKGYDYIGFQVKSIHMAKIARMMKRVRDKCPETKIVIGGYGVATLDTPVPGDKNGDAAYILETADFVCREEGVRYMRRILGDEPVDREITQYDIPMFSMGDILGAPGVRLRFPTILVSLGCPNGCDFCNTSAFFKQKKVYVAEPEQVYRFIRNYQRKMDFREIIVMLWDEDFFINKDYVLELGRLLRSRKSTWSVRYYTFGSIRSLSQYTAEELRDNGLQMVWIGVESFQLDHVEGTSPYEKRNGHKVVEMFEDLRRHGIQPTGSMCMGFDFHTRENLKSDIDQFVALKPTFYQISHVLPCPGTALYDRMLEQDRIREDYKWEDLHFWSSHLFEYENIKREDIQELFEYAHDRLRDVNGPPMLQIMESMMDAYQLYKDDLDPFRQALAKRDRQICAGLKCFLPSIIDNHPSDAARKRAGMLKERYETEMGDSNLVTKALERYISRNIRIKFSRPVPAIASDPPPRWTYYNTFGGDQVWVKKGREKQAPEPYRETGFIAGPKVDGLVSLVGKGMKNVNSIQRMISGRRSH